MAKHRATKQPIPLRWRYKALINRTYLGPYQMLKRLVHVIQGFTKQNLISYIENYRKRFF